MIMNYTDSAAMAALDVCSIFPVLLFHFPVLTDVLVSLLHTARLFDPAVLENSGIMACPLL